MKSINEGKIILGEIFLKTYGREFLDENRDRICTSDYVEGNNLTVKFGVFPKEVIWEGDKLPEIDYEAELCMIATVNLETKDTEVIYKK